MNGFDSYWQRKCAANHHLKDGKSKMTLTVAEFQNQLRKAYTAGHKEGAKKGPSLFDSLFGKS